MPPSTAAASATIPAAVDLPAFLLRPSPILLPGEDPTQDSLDPWRVLRVRSGLEPQVVRSLDDDEIPSWCPIYRSRWIYHRKQRERSNALLPTYVLARFDPTNPYLWHRVMDTTGVFAILPGVVSPAEMATLAALIGHQDDPDDEPYDVHIRHLPLNSSILINRGPFFSYGGVVEACDGVSAWVRINRLLCRDNCISIPAEWCDVVGNQQELAAPMGSRRSHQRARRRRDPRRAKG